jgi:GSH-dependent disulfide-bond oxidoreductase
MMRTPSGSYSEDTGMIDLYTWPTPNGHKIHIMFEEIGMPYNVIPIDIGAGDQFKPDFLKISPNNKMPALVDPEGPDGKPISVFESGAILIYLAEKSGMLLPASPRERYDVLQWLMFQMGGIGPMLGQAHHFHIYAPEKIPYAIERYSNEANRLYGVLDRQLASREFLAETYSIADIATWPWLRSWERQGVNLSDYKNVQRWFDQIAARPAVQRGIKVLSDRSRSGPVDDKTREMLFGKTQYQRR